MTDAATRARAYMAASMMRLQLWRRLAVHLQARACTVTVTRGMLTLPMGAT